MKTKEQILKELNESFTGRSTRSIVALKVIIELLFELNEKVEKLEDFIATPINS